MAARTESPEPQAPPPSLTANTNDVTPSKRRRSSARDSKLKGGKGKERWKNVKNNLKGAKGPQETIASQNQPKESPKEDGTKFANIVHELMRRKDAALADSLMREELNTNKFRLRVEELHDELWAKKRACSELRSRNQDLQQELVAYKRSMDFFRMELNGIRQSRNIPIPEDLGSEEEVQKSMRDYFEHKCKATERKLDELRNTQREQLKPVARNARTLVQQSKALMQTARASLRDTMKQMKDDVELAFMQANPHDWVVTEGCWRSHCGKAVVEQMHCRVNEVVAALIQVLDLVGVKDPNLRDVGTELPPEPKSKPESRDEDEEEDDEAPDPGGALLAQPPTPEEEAGQPELDEEVQAQSNMVQNVKCALQRYVPQVELKFRQIESQATAGMQAKMDAKVKELEEEMDADKTLIAQLQVEVQDQKDRIEVLQERLF
uniref:Uncharacterized protein n=1 Tax=Eutreptiella gymnastica TaxID=73025 RepID=A0A7S1NE86_9EUGL|mmetsp:Transcript_21908/g.39386  ORF Transcript_21908/g.39386 Transcript_21908/m.39386 type:complete len:436 (+) Transcript_21908:88-1395(+)